MGRVKIDIESWSRRREFDFFINMEDPMMSFTSEVEVDKSYATAKSRGESFYLYYAYAITKTVNEIEPLRRRVVSSKEGDGVEVYLYDVVDLLSTVNVSDDGRYIEMPMPYKESFEEFYAAAKEAIAIAPEIAKSGELFAVMDEEHTYNCVSAIPNLYFTSAKHCRKNFAAVDEFTLVNVGKMVVREGKRVIPIGISANHALVDGLDIGKFFDRVQEILDTL